MLLYNYGRKSIALINNSSMNDVNHLLDFIFHIS
jgi:hypothetical protein